MNNKRSRLSTDGPVEVEELVFGPSNAVPVVRNFP